MLTFGFYNSKNGDRKYNAEQFTSIFDGIIRDGIFMSIGNCFRITANGSNMNVTVGTGRAWFNHTWTLNDGAIPLTIPQSEVILNRIDAVIFEVNAEINVRANSIKVIKGTPSSKPSRPVLTNTSTIHQYPLAYVAVNSGVTSIRQADITNMVGSSTTPYVTGILETINIDALVAQWEDQWKKFYEDQTKDITNTNNAWKSQWNSYYSQVTGQMNSEHAEYVSKWNSFYDKQTSDILAANIRWQELWETFYNNTTTQMKRNYTEWVDDWYTFYRKYTMEIDATANDWKRLWADWFYSFVNDNTEEIADWKDLTRKDFMNWWDSLKGLLEGDCCAQMALVMDEFKDRVNGLENFKETLLKERAIYDPLYDNEYRTYRSINDSGFEEIRDSEDDIILSRELSNDPLIDSEGRIIEGRLVFALL